mmetsp:Transcript_24454/g.56900  ORF Transcript_24454/g.56900 Transcript_24454/m.56900 type:complete len:289 (-) Transcript_24454:1082-1948(-)
MHTQPAQRKKHLNKAFELERRARWFAARKMWRGTIPTVHVPPRSRVWPPAQINKRTKKDTNWEDRSRGWGWRARSVDFGRSSVRVLGVEIGAAQLGKLRRDTRILSLVAPRSGWIEDLGRHTSARHRERQIEVVAHFVPRLRELARMHRIDHGARILERTASAVRSATDPAGVEQPRGCALCLQLICKHLRVLQRMPHKEGLAIARRESGDGARDAHLGTRHLGCVPVEKVVDDLLLIELRDRRKHAKAVASEQDDVGRLTWAEGRNLAVGDRLERVGAPRVLGDAQI